MDVFLNDLPKDGIKIILTLLLAFLIGFEREERHTASPTKHFLGGVRTFPLIGLMGYVLAKISPADSLLLISGFIVLGGFMLLSYQHKLKIDGRAGVTSEISGLFTYFIGVLVFQEQFWIATTLVIVTALLLELKNALENLAKKVPEDDIFTFTKFLFLTAVILPILPRKEFTIFNINPFKTWLVVATISGVSYVIYVLKKILGSRESVIISSLLGGAYSSTITTLALAKESQKEPHPNIYAAAILLASGMMYFRLILLIVIFNSSIASLLTVPFMLLGGLSLFGGALWMHFHKDSSHFGGHISPKNPLEIRSAILFGLLFIGMIVITKFVKLFWNDSGILALSALTGLTDIDPFIMGLVQSPGAEISHHLAAQSIFIASISNNIIKSFYVFVLAESQTAKKGALFLLCLSLVGSIYFIIFF